MSRQNMMSPISVLLAGVIVIILLLASSGGNTSALTRRQDPTPTWTPCDVDDNDCLDFQDAYPGGTPKPYPGSDNITSVVTGTATITGTPATGTPTASETLTPTPGTPTPTLTRSANPGGSTESPSE